MSRLIGKKALITGANQGLGLEIARRFIAEGAEIAICARNRNVLERATEELKGNAAAGQRIFAAAADVSRKEDVDRLVSEALQEFGNLDILVNNAGIYGPMGSIEEVNWEHWVRSIEINLFGSILMCRAMLPHLKKRRAGKIIQLSGGGATNPMPNITGYAVSKAAIVRFVESLAEEVREYGIDVNSIAPGALNTRLLDEVLAAGPERVGEAFFERSAKQKEDGGAPLSAGAELAVFLASDASNGITGKLISALWDKWYDWPSHLEELTKSDAYSLRRITGRDRGMAWGDE